MNRRIMVADIVLSARRVRSVAHRRAEIVRNRLPVLPRHGIRLVPPPVRQEGEDMAALEEAAVEADAGEMCP